MRLRELLDGTPAHVAGSDSADIADTTDIADIAIHSQKVTPASVFVAINGVAADGHDYLPEAAKRGAAALVVEDTSRVPTKYRGAVVQVENARATLNHLAARFFGNPGDSLYCVGITGTDGKSTVAWMVEAVLSGCGTPTGVIGTVDHHFTGADSRTHTWPGATTPAPLTMQQRLEELRSLGARAVALEATSQGLSQSRITSVPLDIAVFTNLAHDHLDYHGTLDDYFRAKGRLFTEVLAATTKSPCHAIINIDTAYGARIQVPPQATVSTYGAWGTNADVRYQVRQSGLDGSVVRVARSTGAQAEFHLPMFGSFNAANAAAAVAVGLAAGHELKACVEALASFSGVPGRVQRVRLSHGPLVLVDYAHNPQAFDKLLPALREAMQRERPGAKLITVFGCGGDRDRGKRPLMFQSALRSSDRVFVTTDNPRSEQPENIVLEMTSGVSPADEHRFDVILDRSHAIEAALASSGADDVIAILGKGHERYQVIGAKTFPYAGDADVAQACLRGI
ncbi:MAG: UDP-N-acetylmuramoyl-L-alanyl-D-glutamate--2,6-diaminopimelate ligase [Polyangiales bacterium]